MSEKPRILVIDDQTDEIGRLLQQDSAEVDIHVVHPGDLQHDDLEFAHLAILDYRLGDWWPDGTSFACRPTDGLALMAIISAHLRRMEEEQRDQPPTILSLISADLEALAPADVAPHPHLIARAYGLDWVFPKNNPDVLNRQVRLLASAAHELPSHWPGEPDEAETLLRRLLSLDDMPGEDLAWSAVMGTTPPLHELSQATDGIAVLRWLLHRILPYPTFLWSTHRLATRFRVRHTWLRRQIDQRARFYDLLEPARYDGVLAGFLGERWWGFGVDSIVWDRTDNSSLSIEELHDWLREEIGTELETLDYLHPVICLDRHYQPMDELQPMDVCVRLQRDDWPAHADAPWTLIKIADEYPDVASRVIEDDRDRLSSDDNDEEAGP